MEGNDKSQPQSQSQSQRNLIHGDALAAGGDASAYVQQNDPNSPNASGSAVPSATNTKRNLIVVASFAALIIIVVVILAVTHEFPEWSSSDSSHGAYWRDDDTFEAYYWDEYYGNYGGDGWNDFTFQGNVTYYCGDLLDEPSTAHECASECYYSPDGSSISYWFPKAKVCYCEPFTSPYYKQYENITVKCYNTSDTVEKWEMYEIMDGRPYNIDSQTKDLKADIVRMDCDEYQFYGQDDTEWMDFVMNHQQNVSNNEVVDRWIERSFSEHASIGTFAKFSVELMSLGAPLWFLEKANIAALQEIEHARISFDILNMYLMHNYAENRCVEYSTFPSHSVNIDGDYNRIALDTAIGGCFGETLSAMTYEQYLNVDLKGADIDDVVTQKLNGIATEEVQHAALAWTTVKWIMDRYEDAEVGKQEWWTRELEKRQRGSPTPIETTVYRQLIPSLVDTMFNSDGDYQTLYAEMKESIIQALQEVKENSARSAIVCV